MSEGIDKLAGTIGDALEIAPTIYEDGLQPAIQETGRIVARIPRAINAVLSNFDKWILSKEYSVDETKKLLAQKLKNVNPKKIVVPEEYVAIPAIQAISYSMNSEELRNFYANLLAKAINSDTKEFVHPSFVEIIKQMSPIDAQIFKWIIEEHIRPLITIKINSNVSSNSINVFAEHCSWISKFSLKQCKMSFDNLCRLGLIEIPPQESYSIEFAYDSVKENPLFKNAVEECSKSLEEDESIIFEEEYIKINDFSRLFYRICVCDF